MVTPDALDRALDVAVAASLAAGDALMAIYAGDFDVRRKADASLVTDADHAAEAVVEAHLATMNTGWPVIAEEAHAAGLCTAGGPGGDALWWLVDPLDGTREFVERNGEFTVNVALMQGTQPVLGVVYAPAQRRLFAGRVGHGAFTEDAQGRRPVRCRVPPAEGLHVLSSRAHGDTTRLAAFLAGRPVAKTSAVGSSLKLALIAAGEADLYARFGRTMEWDTAAGHALLLAAGGDLRTPDGSALHYGKAGFENPHFVATGAASAT